MAKPAADFYYWDTECKKLGRVSMPENVDVFVWNTSITNNCVLGTFHVAWRDRVASAGREDVSFLVDIHVFYFES